MNLQPVKMDFRYGGSFGARSPEAYERLLHDAIVGDSTLFTRRDEVERSWQIMDAILEGWRQWRDATPWLMNRHLGPDGSRRVHRSDGRQWRRP